MGQTIADINKKIYRSYLAEGLSHDQAVKKIPRKFRKQFLIDIEKTAIHSHFGIPDKYFFMVLSGIVITVAALALIFG